MDAADAAIRPALAEEAGRVLEMYEWLLAPPGSVPPGWSRDAAAGRLAEAIASERSAVLVADAGGGELVGLCTAYLDLTSVRFGLRCWVEDLAVAPDRRSQGVGGRLLGAARDWAASRGATHLELDTGEAREDARRFYERQRPAWRSVSYAWTLEPD